MESTNNLASLAEFIVQDTPKDFNQRKNQLIRILSRSSTLPKIDGIFIKYLPENPHGFFIQAGRAICLGEHLLSHPAAALLCLRYGFEWQIWYKSQEGGADPRICDLSACNVAAKFYRLMPQEDQKIVSFIPEDLVRVIRKFREAGDTLPELSGEDYKTLDGLHDRRAPSTELGDGQLEPIDSLANPLEYLLMSGGDLRLNVDPERLLNVYECRPFPRPGAFTFASSTATSISNIAYNQTENQRETLIKNSLNSNLFKTMTDFSNLIRERLKKAFLLPESTSILLAPSGTDISLYVAGICQTIFKREIVHILVASDETGSGVPLALEGKHFSGKTSHGVDVEKGGAIEGFYPVGNVHIKLRNEKGQLKKPVDVDKEVSCAVGEAMARGKQAVLHVMDQSKLGYSAPSDPCLDQLQEDYGDKLLVLIDNSQLRIEQQGIQNYIERGFIMTVTGSKFFTGPPFCGALIVPASLNKHWKTVERSLPKGLIEYTYCDKWPRDWAMTRDLEKGLNFGTFMRWYASIAEIERYYETPSSLRFLGTEMFCNHVEESITSAGFLEHLPDFEKEPNGAEETQMENRRTIFPFFVKRQGAVLDREKMKKLYRLLNRDLSAKIEEDSDDLKHLAKQAGHIGQSVKTVYKDGTPTGVVRISLGARVISESWKDRDASIFFKKIEEQMIQVDVIIRKIELILNHPEWLEERV